MCKLIPKKKIKSDYKCFQQYLLKPTNKEQKEYFNP